MALDKRDELYDNLISSGKVTETEIGSKDDFKNALADEKSVREFYKNLSGSGIFSTDEIGSEDDFYGSVSADFAAPPASESSLQPQVATPQDSNIIGTSPNAYEQQDAMYQKMQQMEKPQQQDPNAWRNEDVEVDWNGKDGSITMKRGDIHDQLYKVFSDAMQKGQPGGRSAYVQTYDAANQMAKGLGTSDLMGFVDRVNMDYARQQAHKTVQDIISKLPDKTQDPMAALEAAYYDKDIQRQLYNVANTMGNYYDEVVNKLVKPQLVQAMKIKYGGDDTGWQGINGLFSNWNSINDYWERQHVDNLLGDYYKTSVNEALDAGEQRKRQVINEKTGEEHTWTPGTTGNAFIGEMIDALKKGNEAGDPGYVDETGNASGIIKTLIDQQSFDQLKDSVVFDDMWQRANAKNMSIDDYIKKYVVPVMQKSLIRTFEEEATRRALPKSRTEYILKGLTEDNVAAMIFNKLVRTDSQNRYAEMADMMTAEGKNPNVDPGLLDEGARLASGMAADFWLWGGWGKIGAKTAEKLLSRRLTTLATEKGITEAAAREIMAQEAKRSLSGRALQQVLQHIPQSVVMGAGASTTSSVVRDIKNNEDLETIVGNAFREITHAIPTFTAFGAMSGFTGALSANWKGWKKLLGKALGYEGSAMTLYGTGEMTKAMNGEEAFEDIPKGILKAHLDQLAMNIASNPGMAFKNLAKAVRHPKEWMKTSDNEKAHTVLTDKDVYYLTGTEDGKKIMEQLPESLSDIKPEISTFGVKDISAQGASGTKETAARLASFLNNKDIPQDTKRRIGEIMGFVVPKTLEVTSNITTNDDGTVTLRTRDKDGYVVEEKDFDSKDDADQWQEENQQRLQMNDMRELWNGTSRERQMASVIKMAADMNLDPKELKPQLVQDVLTGKGDAAQTEALYNTLKEIAVRVDEPNVPRFYEQGRQLSTEERHNAALEEQRVFEMIEGQGADFANEVLAGRDNPDVTLPQIYQKYGAAKGKMATIYYNNYAKNKGVMDEINDEVDSAVQAANNRVRENSHPSGNVIEVEYIGRRYYLTDGDIDIAADGSVRVTDRDAVVVRDAQTGDVDMIPADQMTVRNITPSIDMIKANEEILKPQIEQKVLDTVEYAPGTPEEPVDGDVYTGADGQRYMVVKDENTGFWTKVALDENGLATGEPLSFDIDEYKTAKSNEIDAEQQEKAPVSDIEITMPQIEGEKIPLEGPAIDYSKVLTEGKDTFTELTLDDGSKVYLKDGDPKNEFGSVGVWYVDEATGQIKDARIRSNAINEIGEPMKPEDMASGGGRDQAEGKPVGEKTTTKASEQAPSAPSASIPVGNDGNPDFTAATPDVTRKYFTEKYGEQKANDMFVRLAENAAKEYKKLEEQGYPETTDPNEMMAYEDKLEKAKQNAEYWQSLVKKPEKSSVKSFWGNVYNQFKGKAKEAIDFLKGKKEGIAKAALNHPDVGDIDIVWGDENMGLEHILNKHPEVADNLQNILDGMEIVQQSDNRIVLESGSHRAIISKDWKGQPVDNWLLTAYEKKGGVSGGSIDIGPEPTGGKQNGTAPLQNTPSGGKDRKNNSNNQVNQQKNTATVAEKPVEKKPSKKDKIYLGSANANIGNTFTFTNNKGVRSELTVKRVDHQGNAVVDRRDYDANGNPIGNIREERYPATKVGEAIVANSWKKVKTNEEKLREALKGKPGTGNIISVLRDEEIDKLWKAYEDNNNELFNSLWHEYRKNHFEDLIDLRQNIRASDVERAMSTGTKAEKIRKLRKIYQGYEDAELPLQEESMQPQSLEEYVADLLGDVPKPGTGILAYYSYGDGKNKVVGLQDETGFGSRGWGGDTKGFNPWLAPKGKGMSLQKYAENIHSQLPDGIREQYTDQDVRNTLLEVLSSAEKPTDIPNMILRNRAEMAEKATQNIEDMERDGVHYQKKPRDFASRLKSAVELTNTEPSEAQKQAGNYPKGHVSFGGYDYTIENPKGSVRRGTDESGKQWEQEMQNTYGYILGKYGKDGDHLDMFINDSADLDNWNGNVYVVDQVNPKTGEFDEHKVMYGFDSEDAARQAYLSNYEKGWKGLGNITGVPKETFDKWLDSSDRKIKQFADHSIVKKAIEKPVQGLENYSRQEIADIVRDEIQRKLDEAGIDGVELQGVAINGSRGRGDARNDSDLDIVVEYKGNIKEDALFNILNEDPIMIEGIKVDVNPITEGKSGTLDQYMQRSREYDNEVQNKAAKERDKVLMDAETDKMRKIGIKVNTAKEEGQKALDKYNEQVKLARNKKRALDTVVPEDESSFKATAVSSADGAKVVNNLKELAKKSENLSLRDKKNFIGDIADALGAKMRGSKSKYAKFKTDDGTEVTIRLADHNATVSQFDHRGEDNGISIVISRKPNKGVLNDGNAHLVEFFYSDKALKKAEGDSYSQIVNSIKESLHSGKYEDTTGIAERQEVNSKDVELLKQQKVEKKPVFYSNAMKAIETIRQEKATPEQWLAMIQKNGGLKAGEDKWIGLSDWIKEQHETGKKSITKQEIEDYIRQNQIQVDEQHYTEGMPKMAQFALDQFNEEFQDLIWEGEKATNSMYTADWVDYAYEQMVDRYGDDFRDAFDIGEGTGTNSRLTPTLDYYDNMSFAAKYFLGMEGGDERPIDETRLNYTTEGLENKREIALTVPTIEPYNEGDEIHFGDAGEGRAIAWVRFGDAYVPVKEKIYKHVDEFDELLDEAKDNMNAYYQNHPKEQKKGEQKILVIDEIQSKRHQDGREKGYLDIVEEDRLKNEYLQAEGAVIAYRKSLHEKYPEMGDIARLKNIGTSEEYAQHTELTRLSIAAERALIEYRNKHGVPDAPFEKNWHELAMKRMLRYAAENGYDKIAWTTGEQQAERYNIGKFVSEIKSDKKDSSAADLNKYFGVDFIDQNGSLVNVKFHDNTSQTIAFTDDGTVFAVDGSEVTPIGSKLSEVFGKDIAEKIAGMSEGDTLKDDSLRIGAEGMKGFYDQMLPRFMDKYGKKWGVKTEEVELPDNIEKTGSKMWSIDVTPEMKESVMEGQPMFFKTPDGEAYGFTLNDEIYLDPKIATAETPIHEYGHLWVDMKRHTAPEEWENMKRVLLGDKLIQPIIDKVRDEYPELAAEDKEDAFAEEILTQFSGKRGTERLREIAEQVAKERGGVFGKAEAVTAMQRLKNILNDWWKSIANMLGVKYRNANDIADMMMKDFLNDINPVEEKAKAKNASENDKTLIGVHNISEEKLKKALKQGGLANPSMAVFDTRNYTHTDYGEISLIPKSSLIDSRTGRNAGTYSGDAWTPTYPAVSRFLTNKGDKHRLQIAKEAAGGDAEIERHLAGRIYDWVEGDSDRLHFLFLKQKGMNPEVRPERTIHSPEEFEEIQKIFGERTSTMPSDFTKEQSDALLDLMLRTYEKKKREDASTMKDAEKREAYIDAMKKIYLKNLVDENGKLWFAKGDSFVHENWRDEQRRKNPKPDWYGTENDASYRVAKERLAEEYEKWKESLLNDEDIEEKLFAGWTPDGDRRYVANTVQNASRLMNKEAKTNTYGNGGVNASKAGLLKKLKTLSEIRKYRHLLKNEDQIKEQAQQASDEWFDIISQVSDMKKIDNNPFINNDIAEARLQEAITEPNPISYLNKEYGYNIDKNSELASNLMNFIDKAKEMPVKYFETKFERPVGIEEFAIAVVPTTTSPEVVKALQDAGLEIHTYEKGDTGDPKDSNRIQAIMDAVKNRDDIMFQKRRQEEKGISLLEEEKTVESPQERVTNREIGGALVDRLNDMGVDVGTDISENRKVHKIAEKPSNKPKVRSLMQLEIPFEEQQPVEQKPVEIAGKPVELQKMSDEELLDSMSTNESRDRDFFVDEYDKRHREEYTQSLDSYAEMLDKEAVSLDDAYDMYASVSKMWSEGGFKSSERSKLMGQIDALEEYVDRLESDKLQQEIDTEKARTENPVETSVNVEKAKQFEEQKAKVRNNGYDLTKLRMRELNEGEACHVERRYIENKNFSFTGGEHIESSDDVAYIFRELEDSSVENSFLVLLKDGVPTVIHVGLGGYNVTPVLMEQAFVAAKAIDPDHVIFLHNHPSGKLTVSGPDREVQSKIEMLFGEKARKGIIINTKSGKYAEFNSLNDNNISSRPQTIEGEETPVKVYSFSKNVFDKDWNPDDAFRITTPENVAAFVSSHRLGDHPKMSLLVLDQAGHITGNVFLPWTNIYEASKNENAQQIATYVNQMGGNMCVIYGNYKAGMEKGEWMDTDSAIKIMNQKLRNRNVRLFDVLNIDRSAFETGILDPYKKMSQNTAGEEERQERLNRDVAEAISFVTGRSVEDVRREREQRQAETAEEKERPANPMQEDFPKFQKVRKPTPHEMRNKLEKDAESRRRDVAVRKAAEAGIKEPTEEEYTRRAISEYYRQEKQWHEKYDGVETPPPPPDQWQMMAEAQRQFREDRDAYEKEIEKYKPVNSDQLSREDVIAEREAQSRTPGQKLVNKLQAVMANEESPETAADSVRQAVIDRRKNINDISAEDAIYINDVNKQIKDIAKQLSENGEKIKDTDIQEALPYLIEAPMVRNDIAYAVNEQLKAYGSPVTISGDDIKWVEPYIDIMRKSAEQLLDINKLMNEEGRTLMTVDEQAVNDTVREDAEHIAAGINSRYDRGNNPVTADDIMAALSQITRRVVPDGLKVNEDTKELIPVISGIKDWYNIAYDWLMESGMGKQDTGYVKNYINHVWDREKSDPDAYQKFVVNQQPTTSRNMRKREIRSLMEGLEVGLVPKFTKIGDLMGDYSSKNILSWANRKMLNDLSYVDVIERNDKGEEVGRYNLLSSTEPMFIEKEKYDYFDIPGVGMTWVYRPAAKDFGLVFESYEAGKPMKVYDTMASLAKKIELSWSGFHAGALSEVYAVQNSIEFGPIPTAKYFYKYLINDCIATGESPAYANPEDYRTAARHLVRLGATDDYSTEAVQNFSDNLRNMLVGVRNELWKKGALGKTTAAVVEPLALVSEAIRLMNEGSDKLLWTWLHDGLKIATFKMREERTVKRLNKKYGDAVGSKEYQEELDKELDRDGQYVNDMFGGQYWEVINISPKTLRNMRRFLLSPDWLISTQRHFLGLLGYGDIYSHSRLGDFRRFASLVKSGDADPNSLPGLYAGLLGRGAKAIGINNKAADIPLNKARLQRARSSLLCYALGVGLGYQLVNNALNAIMRKWDEESELEKERTIDGYTSIYKKAYPNGMRWYDRENWYNPMKMFGLFGDYGMEGNALGKKTHVFSGHYDNGTEIYLRTGKQFKEFPDFWENEKGELEFPRPLINRLMGKSNPNIRFLYNTLNYYTRWDKSQDDEELEAHLKKFWENKTFVGVGAGISKIAENYKPFWVPTQEGKDWVWTDMFFPSSKGFTPYKARNYFEEFIKAGDRDGIEKTFMAAAQNGMTDAQIEDAYMAAQKTVESDDRDNRYGKFTDIQAAMDAFDNAQTEKDRRTIKGKIDRMMRNSIHEEVSRDDILNLFDNYMENDEQTNKQKGYLSLCNSADVVEDSRLRNAYRLLKSYNDTLEEMKKEGALKPDLDSYRAMYRHELKAYKEVAERLKWIQNGKKMEGITLAKGKKQLGDKYDQQIMDNIRHWRREALDIAAIMPQGKE